jgi:hypothetical protein
MDTFKPISRTSIVIGCTMMINAMDYNDAQLNIRKSLPLQAGESG